MRPLVNVVVVAAAIAAGTAAQAQVAVQPRLEPSRLSVGQAATLEVRIVGTQDAGMPAIDVPDGVRMEYRGQSTQVSIVNGAVSSTLTHSFLVVPQRAGTFALGPVRVEAGGRIIDGGTVRLEVAQGVAPRSSGAAAARAPAPDERLRLFVDLHQPRMYLHQRLPVRVRLEVGDVQVTDVRYPTLAADGFAVGKLAEPAQRQEVRGGRPVHVVEFTTHVVPLRTGELPIEAGMQLSVVTRRGSPLFDHFFSMDPSFGGRKSVSLATEPLAVTVLPLPVEGRPPSFSGAVGRFTIEATAQQREVRAGDPVTVSIVLRGAGNVAHARMPALAGSDLLKVYPPNTTAEREDGLDVEKRFEQVVIPNRAGATTLPAVEFSYFDPAIGRYERAATPAMPIAVLAAPAAPPAVVTAPTPAPAAGAPETLGRDLVSIKDDPGTLRPVGDRRHRRAGFWAAQ